MIGDIVMHCLILVSLVSSTPLNNILGPWSCTGFWWIYNFLTTNVFFAGQALVLFRFLSTKFMKFIYEVVGKFWLMFLLMAYQFVGGTMVTWNLYRVSQRSGN